MTAFSTKIQSVWIHCQLTNFRLLSQHVLFGLDLNFFLFLIFMKNCYIFFSRKLKYAPRLLSSFQLRVLEHCKHSSSLFQCKEHEEGQRKMVKLSFESAVFRIAMIKMNFHFAFISKTELEDKHDYSLGLQELILFI